MAQTVLITLTTAGTDVGPFDLYSDADGYASSFQTGVSKPILVAGYICTIVPDGATIIKLQSYGTCTNNIYLNITSDPPTTTTTTSSSTSSSTSTTTSTTTSYCQSIGSGTGCYNWNIIAGLSGAVVQVINCSGINTSVVLGASGTGNLCACDGITPTVTAGSATLNQVGQC